MVAAASQGLKTVGALDLGGSSLEVTFVPSKLTPEAVKGAPPSSEKPPEFHQSRHYTLKACRESFFKALDAVHHLCVDESIPHKLLTLKWGEF